MNKNAAKKVLGKEPGKRGRKADPNKSKKEKSTGSEPKTAKAAKVDGPSSADISSDETAKALSASTPEEKKKKFNMGLRFKR